MQLNKRGKPSLDIHMEDKTVHSFAADNEAEIDGWLAALEKVVHSNEQGSVDRLRGTVTLDNSFLPSKQYVYNSD